MVRADTNEKLSAFSKNCTFDYGTHIINVKNERLNNYIWWKGLLKPQEIFNPEKTKGFLVLRLLFYGYLNRICTSRSNSDNALMYPYLKILLNDKEIYRTKILKSCVNIWDEKIEVQIHYIQSKLEIQLYDLDETEGVVEDEYIGSAIINVFDLKLSKKYDIVIKFIDKKGILTDPYVFKSSLNEELKNGNKKEEENQVDNNDDDDDDRDFIDMKNKKGKETEMGIETGKEKKTEKGTGTGTTSYKKKAGKKNDYNIRIFAKLINKYQFSNSILELNKITSINYKLINESNEILDSDLNVKKLYEDIKHMKLNFDNIWLPFFLIIYNFVSWKTPFYSIFFFFFLCFSLIFTKLFFSFFLLSLSLIIFIFVSIIKESDDKLKSKHLAFLKKKKSKQIKFQKKRKKKGKHYYNQMKAVNKKKDPGQNFKRKMENLKLNDPDLTNEATSIDSSLISSSSTISNISCDTSSSSSSSISISSDDNDMFTDSSTFKMADQKTKKRRASSILLSTETNKRKQEISTNMGKKDATENTSEWEAYHKQEEEEEEEEEADDDDDDDDDEDDDENDEEEEDEKNDKEKRDEGKENKIETDLTVVKTFISNVLDDEIICNVKYIHFLLSSLIQISQNILNVFRKFGYLLVLLSWFLCILNIFFYSTVAKLLRFSFFFSGFVLLTYNFKPVNAVYRFLRCSREYYFLKIKSRNVDIFNGK